MFKKTSLCIAACLIAFSMIASSCSAGWFGKEKAIKEIKDEYLTKLFEPGIPYESIKVMEDSAGRRFIVIKTIEKVTEKTLSEYDDLLLSRGVNIYGTFHHGTFSWQKTVSDFAITITRKVEGYPDTIEISESVVMDPAKKEPIVAAVVKDKEIRIAIIKDFGMKWKKMKLMPDKEPDAPEPKIGRYPGSRLVEVSSYGKGKMYVFVSKDSFKEVAIYFEKKLKIIFKKELRGSLDIAENKEKLDNPKKNVHPLKLFNIRTNSQRLDMGGSQHVPEWFSTHVTIKRSSDPNLSKYLEINLTEN